MTRAPSGGTPAPAEQLARGDEVTMAEGDALFFDDDLHTVHNAGDEPTVLLISAFLEASEPPVIFHEGMPAP